MSIEPEPRACRFSRCRRALALITVYLISGLASTLAQTHESLRLPPVCDLQPARQSRSELADIGQRIFGNECAGKNACLLHWNVGEAFPSLGIGHFIWYPAGKPGPFVESFPRFVAYVRAQFSEQALPAMLRPEPLPPAPWSSPREFLSAHAAPQKADLMAFLESRFDLQSAFLMQRASQALPQILRAWNEEENPLAQPGINFMSALCASHPGRYALTDYVNFKGEGLSPTERYKGQGWGLKQVLETGAGRFAGEPPENAARIFAEAAARVLERRANLADQEIERSVWLPGWHKRVATYACASPPCL